MCKSSNLFVLSKITAPTQDPSPDVRMVFGAFAMFKSAIPTLTTLPNLFIVKS